MVELLKQWLILMLMGAVTLLFVLQCDQVNAETTKIAIIDSGFTPMYSTNSAIEKLCDSGSYDFDLGLDVVGFDMIGHGTFVHNIIVSEAPTKDFCIMHFKVFGFGSDYTRVRQAIKKAVDRGAKVINMSLGIFEYDRKDRDAVRWATKKGVKIFLAAGNNTDNMNVVCRTYPQCYKTNSNMIIVGALDQHYDLTTYTNTGMRVMAYELGDYKFGRGTSFATPKALGKYLQKTLKDVASEQNK